MQLKNNTTELIPRAKNIEDWIAIQGLIHFLANINKEKNKFEEILVPMRLISKLKFKKILFFLISKPDFTFYFLSQPAESYILQSTTVSNSDVIYLVILKNFRRKVVQSLNFLSERKVDSGMAFTNKGIQEIVRHRMISCVWDSY